ncbi:hypothetical protein KFL_001600080 [Klebsormidium nitens]|uniref:Cell division cycle protein 123 n=1 Tax=Klebsormidium nitens TaxID=105231 RepID=A0A1Y1I2V1_KLENI|nr:hypothetical protein KFL_001600080 [Klebsormidium nitens]|eukprot:GAQ83739.1 hypothetical protein KFL_001600080 [Klebsormidium nitens]
MAHNDEVPSQSVQQILNCQYQEWYPHFKSLSFRSEIIPIPRSFVSYLLDDGGVFLPESSDALPRRFHEDEFSAVDNSEYRRWGEEPYSSQDDGECMSSEARSFPELEKTLDEAIARLGGTVVPKLNWSCPKDTAWVSPSGSVKCDNGAEVLLLLKSSDIVVHDLCHAFDNCRDGGLTRPEHFVLVLKKWHPLRPEMEFRCFVKGNQLRGICQREVTSFYPSILESRKELGPVIETFIQDHVLGHFPDPDFVCDVYVTSDRRVKIMDFNPYGGGTLPLLFSWSDFEEAGTSERSSETKQTHPESGRGESASTGVCAEGREPGVGLRVSTSRGANLDREGSEQNEMNGDGTRRSGRTETSFGSNETAERPDRGLIVDELSAASRGEQTRSPVEFRIVETAMGVMPSMAIAGGAPFDLVDLSSGGAIDDFIKRAAEAPGSD